MNPPSLVIFILSGSTPGNQDRRRSLRNSWLRYKHDRESPLDEALRESVSIVFVIARGSPDLQHEADEHGDMVLVDAPEGYEHLWRKALTYLENLESSGRPFDFAMHADDDSFVRLDLLLPFLATCPRQRFYWGYIWDGTGNRVTAPIRNVLNKSHMPAAQYAADHYPPFASGCGFLLSRDLVQALVRAAPLPDYRLLDPPFGIHLCEAGPACVVSEPVVPVHDERVRPYRPIPMFRPDTMVQHYMRAEEMRPYYLQALQCVGQECVGSTAAAAGDLPGGCEVEMGGEGSGVTDACTPQQLYERLVGMGLLRR